MAKFIARCDNQVLCMVPESVVFQNGIPQIVPGKEIRFENGVYETKDKDEIKFINKHPRRELLQIFEDKGAEQEEAPQEPPAE